MIKKYWQMFSFRWRSDSLEKTLMLGKSEGRRRRGLQRMRWLDGITDLMDMSLVNSRSWQWTGTPGVLQSMGSQRVRRDWATELNCPPVKIPSFYHPSFLPSSWSGCPSSKWTYLKVSLMLTFLIGNLEKMEVCATTTRYACGQRKQNAVWFCSWYKPQLVM